MSEVLKCFKFLAESAPAWLKSLQDLEEKVRQRKAEVEKMSRTPSQTVRKRSGSNESLRPSRDDTGNCPSVVGGGEQQQMSMSSPYAIPVLQRTPSNTSKRKRIASSIASITSATQKRYRARNPIIVYYDSEVQKGFEHLVQGIGSGRNYIRKARLAIRMETLTTEFFHCYNDDNDARSMYPRRPSPRLGAGLVRIGRVPFPQGRRVCRRDPGREGDLRGFGGECRERSGEVDGVGTGKAESEGGGEGC
ncbi:hypothetical protein BLS_000998 [Venturia inaequalis]|uniref:Uncharacterized protein n=1 Tax=Venturia inaequalis TaxID=5025 RepID=A0A8H3U302_VENIN|nr:hypothetical protein BLS_000998 [Venturia inaequalis]